MYSTEIYDPYKPIFITSQKFHWATSKLFQWKPSPCADSGDGSKPISGANSISTGIKIVPVASWGPRKTCFSSKMMNFQPRHMQKRKKVELQIIKFKYKSKKNLEPFNSI